MTTRKKLKFRKGQRVKFTNTKDGNYEARLTGREKGTRLWNWKIKGFATGTSPESALRPLTAREKGRSGR